MLIQNHMAINLGKWDNFHISSETLWRLIRLKHCKWVSATNSRRLCIKGAQLSDLLSSHLVSIQVMRFYRGSVERTGVRAASATHFSLGAKFNSRNGKDKFCWSWIEIYAQTSLNTQFTHQLSNKQPLFFPPSFKAHALHVAWAHYCWWSPHISAFHNHMCSPALCSLQRCTACFAA